MVWSRRGVRACWDLHGVGLFYGASHWERRRTASDTFMAWVVRRRSRALPAGTSGLISEHEAWARLWRARGVPGRVSGTPPHTHTHTLLIAAARDWGLRVARRHVRADPLARFTMAAVGCWRPVRVGL